MRMEALSPFWPAKKTLPLYKHISLYVSAAFSHSGVESVVKAYWPSDPKAYVLLYSFRPGEGRQIKLLPILCTLKNAET